ncbi:MAG: hypothetical protein QM734_00875 [Cyclobacteriaceae bacterium]
MEKPDEVKKWIDEIFKINPDHFEANEEMIISLNKEAKVFLRPNVTRLQMSRKDLNYAINGLRN